MVDYLSLLQTPSSEQGGVEHRSSRPQHVVPLGEESLITIEPGEEINLSIFVEPQWGQTGNSFCLKLLCKISDAFPQSSHRYSYIGINLSPSKPLCVGAIHESPLLRLNTKIVFQMSDIDSESGICKIPVCRFILSPS